MLSFRASRRPRARLARVLAAALVAAGALVRSPSPARADQGTQSAPVAPKLKSWAEPTMPPPTKEKPEENKTDETIVVILELTLDATGKVVGATVTKSGGAAFDAAALEAAPRLVFEPATRDGKPIAARVPFKYEFAPKTVLRTTSTGGLARGTPAAPIAFLPGLTGEVRTPAEEPLVGARVTVFGRDGTTRAAVTDEKGTFAVPDLAPGKYTVRVEAAGFDAFEAEEEITAGNITHVVYRPPVGGDTLEIVVKGERPPREVTKRTIEVREVTRIPGTNGDALRAVQSLPGVARPPGLAGLLIIRGSSPQDTNVFIDGTLVPIVYHFGGLSSVVPSELLDRIDFYPGNFGPEYGRVMGGIVDVGLRSPKKDGYHGLLQFDLIDGRILAEGPIDSKTRFLVAGRRSWVDLWLKPVLTSVGTGVSTAPVYYDYQVMVERDVTTDSTARLTLFGSDDRLALTLNSPSSSDPALGGDLSARSGFLRVQGRIETRVGKDVRWLNTVAYGYDLLEFAIGDFFFRVDGKPLTLRSDVRAKLSKEATVIVGLDFLMSSYTVDLNLPPRPATGEAPGPFFARPPVHLTGRGMLYRPGAYAMLEVSPVRELKLLPGVRLDYSSDGDTWVVSPRFAARWDVNQPHPRTTLKGGVGIFQQPPGPGEAIEPFGNPHLTNARATHYDLGFEQELTKQIDVSVDGFFKDLQNLVTVQSASSSNATGTTYANGGSGRVYGMEILLRYKPDDRFFGWLAYTLSRSERRDAPGLPLHGYQFDQPHIFTIIGSYKLGRGWEVGARFRYVSGSLYTPNIGGVMDYDAGAYAPVPDSNRFSRRLPAFNQLDLRIDKAWKFPNWRLSAYLDVQNVFNRQNPEGLGYNYNYSKSSIASGLPILPVLGIRGEL